MPNQVSFCFPLYSPNFSIPSSFSKLDHGLTFLINITTEWTKQSTMYLIKRRIEGVVKDAYETECDRRNIVDEKGRKLIALQRASEHVMGGYRGVDIISQCQLESVNRRSGVLSYLFKIRNHYLWTIFMHVVVITHVALCFFESKSIRTNDTWTIFGRQFYVGVESQLHFLFVYKSFTFYFFGILWTMK